MSAPRIVVLGGINMDLVVHTPRLPRPGETVEAASVETTPGGKGANQAIAAARALEEPGSVAMVGRVGDDVYGEQLLAYMDESGVDRTGVAVSEGAASGLAFIFIDEAGENTVTAVYGANAGCGEAEVAAVAARFESAEVLLVQQETPLAATLAAMQAAVTAGVTVILDPAPARELPVGFLGFASIITPNQGEAEALSGIAVTDEASAVAAARAIREQHGVETVIVTMGEMGAMVVGAESAEHVPPFPVQAVASVGAGDAFNGALAAALVSGQSLAEAAPFAAAAGAVCVTKEGAAASMATREEILAMLVRR